ncbi:MAG: hypothetical protein ACERKV_03910 [Clostridiaceae bacterium]
MAKKLMKHKKIFIPLIALLLVILVFQVKRFTKIGSEEMVAMIDNDQSISLNIKSLNYDDGIDKNQQTDMDWVQLDQLNTFNNGFRQGFDDVFNINIVTESGIDGKSGCLYVDDTGDRNGNTTLCDAFRNKVFVTKYWNDSSVKDSLINLSSEAYTDVYGNETYKIAGTLNAYYNLMAAADDLSTFSPTQSLSREEFYALIFKTENGVREIIPSKTFEKAIGGETNLSKYAQEVEKYGFLSISNKSLDSSSYKSNISRAEAIYMIVNENFPDELAKISGKEKAFSDTKNCGDLALKADFKYKDKDTKEVIGKERWQSYTLAYMLQNPDDGMQEELYNAMVVAKNLKLISGDESRWDEPISKAESIMLIVNTQLAKNKLYGYLSEAEYGEINVDKFTTGMADKDKAVNLSTSQGPADPDKVLSSGLTLYEAKIIIDDARDEMKRAGCTGDELEEMMKYRAEDLGTTLDEISRMTEKQEVVTKPTSTSTSNNSGSSSQSGNSSGTTSNNSSGVSSRIDSNGIDQSGVGGEYDKNGDGINDACQQGATDWNSGDIITTTGDGSVSLYSAGEVPEDEEETPEAPKEP